MKHDLQISALMIVINILISKLDKNGILSKDDFARILRNDAGLAQELAPENIRNLECYDLDLLHSLADLLDQLTPKRWTPTVIEGGRDEK